jgi:signal transduction histidine kinase
LSRDPWRAARWSFAVRLTLLVTLLVASGGAGLYTYVRQTLLGAFDEAHDMAISSLLEDVHTSGTSVAVEPRGFADEFGELKNLGVVAAGVWAADGRELAHASINGLTLTKSGPAREVVGVGELTVVVRRQEIGAGEGMIAVARAGGVERDLRSLRHGLFLLLPIALLGALGVGWVMAGQALRRVHAAFERQRAFMADASHELRTPLAVIRAHAEVQLEGGDEHTRLRSLEVVARTAAQMGTLVDDLLFLSRSDGSALTLHRARLALDGIVDEVVDAFTPIARKTGSRLELSVPEEDVEIDADPAQLKRLFGILVDNALRHGNPGTVEISVTRAGDSVRVSVEDPGPGISPSLLPRVFERFARGSSSSRSSTDGHGLGLAIARTIVSAHGGTISLERSALGGTAARVVLPTSL